VSYAVKEIFYTLQGEGVNTGRAAVFCRFAGCNLWTGREKDRATAACKFCDTDFVGTDGFGGGKFATASDLAHAVSVAWQEGGEGASDRGVKSLLVCTGGEPLLQVDDALVAALHIEGFEIAVETNGTQPAPDGIDWICVSPKAGEPLVQSSGHELKLVYPQREAEAQPERFVGLDFRHFFLQPMDGPEVALNTRAAVEYCLTNPRWRLSLQTHKTLGIR
jgi:7-carboxy-7-deazaguanine synthase